MIVLTLFSGSSTSLDRSGELAATVVGVLLADSSATLGFVLPSAMAEDAKVSETSMSVFQTYHVCMCEQCWVTKRPDSSLCKMFLSVLQKVLLPEFDKRSAKDGHS